MQRIKNAHAQSAGVFEEIGRRQRNPSRHVRIILALRQAIDAIDEERGPHGFACSCETCTDIRCIRWSIDTARGWIESNVSPDDLRLAE